MCVFSVDPLVRSFSKICYYLLFMFILDVMLWYFHSDLVFQFLKCSVFILETFKRLYCTRFPCLPVPSKKFRTRLVQGISKRQSRTEIDQKTLATPKPTPKRLLPSHRLHNRLRGVGNWRIEGDLGEKKTFNENIILLPSINSRKLTYPTLANGKTIASKGPNRRGYGFAVNL